MVEKFRPGTFGWFVTLKFVPNTCAIRCSASPAFIPASAISFRADVPKAVYGTDKADWSRVPDAEAIFDAEDRAFLEIGAEADDDFEFE